MTLPTSFQFALGLGASGALVDVSSYLWADGGFSRVGGRESVFDGREPGSFSFTLVNADGRFTPGSTAVYATALDQGTRVCTSVDGRLVEGVVDSITPSFGEDGIPSWARVTVQCFDMLGVVARNRIRALGPQLAESIGVGQYWPLDDPAGSTSARDVLGGLPLLAKGELSGVRFGRETDLTNSFDTVLELNAGSTSSRDRGWLAVQTADDGPLSARLWFTLLRESSTRGALVSLTRLFDTGSATVPWTSELLVGTSSLADRLVYGTNTYDLTYSGIAPLSELNGKPRFVEVLATSFAVVVIVDGVVVLNQVPASNPSGSALSSTFVLGSISISARLEKVARTPAGSTELAYSEYLRTANSTEANIDDALDAIETLAPIPNDTLPAFRGRLGPLDGNGKTVFDLYDEITELEAGELYPTTTGTLTTPTTTVTIRNRDSSRPSTVTLTISARDDLAEVPNFTFDNTDRVSIVDASSEIDAVTVVDTTLQTRIGSVSGSVEIPTSWRNQLVAAAEDRIVRGNTTGIRIESVTVDLATSPNLDANDLLSLNLGDRVQITDLPQAQLGYTTRDGWVRGISELHTVGSSRFTLYLEPAFSISVFDTDRFSDSGALTLDAAIDASVTSFAVDTTGPTLSTTDTPYTIQVGSEQMTVTACTSATPQVVTVTRGVNGTTAASHLINAPVVAVGAGRFAY